VRKRQDGQEAADGKPTRSDVRNQAYSSFVGNRKFPMLKRNTMVRRFFKVTVEMK